MQTVLGKSRPKRAHFSSGVGGRLVVCGLPQWLARSLGQLASEQIGRENWPSLFRFPFSASLWPPRKRLHLLRPQSFSPPGDHQQTAGRSPKSSGKAPSSDLRWARMGRGNWSRGGRAPLARRTKWGRRKSPGGRLAVCGRREKAGNWPARPWGRPE